MYYCNGYQPYASNNSAYGSMYCPSATQYIPVITSYRLVSSDTATVSQQTSFNSCNDTDAASSASCGCNRSSYSNSGFCCRCCWFR